MLFLSEECFLFPQEEMWCSISREAGDCAVRAKPRLESAPSDSSIITKATIRAARKLNLKNKDLAPVLGLSEPTVSRMMRGKYPLDPALKSFELALL
ncbi:MAG TPA: helix-turn-helix transcriptional regulator, partial [Xanthobacteraceae bacterium]|nr:helix-turn-helix transcriptional regulator [Xanthobacteraceae bacterium]